ncbi:hypothetical protein Scep_028748 [Stephania cephalantha]|uniref:Ubiquitin carboxyl-terminal hydrolase n=1 Tax=Stephania cephalantha TaxID=152367 RepID=A0AAP0EAH8_9MAGN
MESSISASEVTPEHERLAIRDIAMAAESQSKEGDSFFLITHRFPSFLNRFHSLCFQFFRLSVVLPILARIRRSNRVSVQKHVVLVVDGVPVMFCANPRWWQHWLDYVNQDLASAANDGSSSYGPENYESVGSSSLKRPSTIDNSDLIYDAASDDSNTAVDLHDALVEGRDYILLPEQVWNQLFLWYGGGPTLPKKVINSGLSQTELAVEVYLLRLQLLVMPKGEHAAIRISKKETVRELHRKACEIFDFNLEQICIWDYYGHRKHALMNDMDKTLDDANIQMDQDILVEILGDGNDNAFGGYLSSVQENGSAEKESTSVLVESGLSTAGGLSTSKGVSRSCSSEMSQSQYLASPIGEVDNSYGTSSIATRGSSGGLTGLLNLGNTCFMNSAIQCLVHTPEFARYFREDYHPDINFTNSMGMVGELSLAFGELLRKLWAPGRTPIAPRPFKAKLARFAPQFSGYNQHDSQELLAFLLDGLHEDLNRAKHRPFTKSKNADGDPDEEEYWQNYIARNDSIIVDVCQGLSKSSLVCPVCGKISVTFDPFLWLSLPLQSANTRSMIVTVFASDGSALPTPCTVSVPKQGRCRDLIHAAGSACSLKLGEKLLLAEIRAHSIHRFLEDSLIPLSTVKDDDRLVAYKLPKFVKNSVFLQLINRRQEQESSSAHSSKIWKPYGSPLVSLISRDDRLTGGDVQSMVLKMLNPMLRTRGPGQPDNLLNSRAIETTSQCQDVGSNEAGADSDASDCVVRGEIKLNMVDADKFSLQFLDENNAFIDLSLEEEKPIKLTSSSSVYIPIFIDWSEKQLEKYDTHYFENLPEVLKYGPALKKARTEPLSLYSCLEAFLREEPLVTEDMWRQLYELYALSNHYGSMGSGHYTAHIKLLDENKWYNFDDSHVSLINEEEVKSAAAYVLFYRRVKSDNTFTSNGS